MFTFEYALILALILGLVHGITPDEHTWPITFSYAIGSYSTKGGFKAGLYFSLAFTAQRALMSELAFLALASFFMNSMVDTITYILVGFVMWLAGAYVINKGVYFHAHIFDRLIHRAAYTKENDCDFSTPSCFNPKQVPIKATLVHGAVAGFGFGAFALVLFTLIVPAMPNLYFGFLPGLLFGVGTMLMQIMFGMAFGKWMESRKFEPKEISFIAHRTSGSMLYYGGIAFMVIGALLLALPNLGNIGIKTPLNIYNLDVLGIGFFLIVTVLVLIGIPAYLRSVKLVEKEHLKKQSNS